MFRSFLTLSMIMLLIACNSQPDNRLADLPPRCESSQIPINGQGLWVDKQDNGPITVLFEAGGGNDSTVWADIVPQVQAMQTTTMTYDRAGLGRSDVDPSPYRIMREVSALRGALDYCEVQAPIIIVAHSYGGIVALLTAVKDARVQGVVLLDAVVPGFYTPQRVQNLVAEYRPQYDAVREKAPKLARAIIPMMEAYPETTATLNNATIPESLPVIDIVAEHPAENTPADIDAWKYAHAQFVEGHDRRHGIIAQGSGHHIAREKPELVIDAISQMVEALKH